MPLINSAYKHVPFYMVNSHLETIMPSMFRKVNGSYTRERLELTDGDFLDLDWMYQDSNRLVIITHGLEGSSDRHYVKGIANYFYRNGWDALAWNCRGCSGVMNRLPRFYHHGATEDLDAVIQNALSKNYTHITLVGISMGGSMTLKYLGEREEQISHSIKRAAVFSVPCHLGSSARELDKPNKKFYLNRFLKKLEKKIKAKAVLFPDIISAEGYHHIKTFRDFDNRYTAPLHGFINADDFYEKASSWNYLKTIKVPTLLVNALNDPFLPDDCYPYTIAKEHEHLFFETPERGGHVGFSVAGKNENWMEIRSFEFLSSL